MSERVIDTGISEGDLLDQLAAEYRAQQKADDEFTAADFAARLGDGTPQDKARDFLDRLVREKRLTVRKLAIGNVYRRVK